MSLIKSPANGVVIKRKISDGLKEIVSLKEKILLETTAKIQSIEEKREEKFIQGYYDGYTKGIIDVMDNFIPLISLLSSTIAGPGLRSRRQLNTDVGGTEQRITLMSLACASCTIEMMLLRIFS